MVRLLAAVSLIGCGRLGFESIDAGNGNASDAPMALRGCVRTFSATGGFACVARTDGQVWCWGAGALGQLGDGSIDRLTPGPAAIDDVRIISTGEATACAVKRDGSLWCWGDGALGQIGDGLQMSQQVPVPISSLPGPVAKVHNSATHTCAMLVDGRGYCWGSAEEGALGPFISAGLYQTVPFDSFIGGNLDFALGDDVTCALRPDRTVECWGNNDEGSLGDGTTTKRLLPDRVLGIPDPVIQLAGGCHKHLCVVTDRHEAWCWGTNNQGQATGTTTSAALLSAVRIPIAQVEQVAVGAFHTCVRTTSDQVFCWGENTFGQTGVAPSMRQLPPVLVDAGGPIVDLQGSCGGTLALRADATLVAWGDNKMLGTGETMPRIEPAEVPVPCP